MVTVARSVNRQTPCMQVWFDVDPSDQGLCFLVSGFPEKRIKMKCFLALPECSSQQTSREELTADKRRLLHLRSNSKNKLLFVCHLHYKRYLKDYPAFYKKCFDPFNNHEERKTKKSKLSQRSLLEVTLQMRDKVKTAGLEWYKVLIPGQKICVSCKLEVYNQIKLVQPEAAKKDIQSSPSVSSSLPTPASDFSKDKENEKDEPYNFGDIKELNDWLQGLGVSPINKNRLQKQKNYGMKALEKLKKGLMISGCCIFPENEDISDYRDMISQLKEFVLANPEPGKKLLALSVLPKSWSLAKIENTFNVSNYLARKSKDVVQETGILSNPSSKLGRPVPDEAKEKVRQFFLREDVSRSLPGKKDFVSVKENGVRRHERKRLVLSTLSKLYTDYSNENPQNAVSFSKFCQLRPKQCVLAGRAGTHVVCVCTYHQNVQLMFEGALLKNAGFASPKECREMLMCGPEPTRNCFLRSCQKCPDDLALKEKLELYFDSEMIDLVTFNQWESTDRGNIATLNMAPDDFILKFTSALEDLITHDHISKQQSDFFNQTKKDLEEGEILVTLDFAENFTFVVQNSIQSNYFRNDQATVHPCVVYYKKDGTLQHKCYVIISDHLQHSTAAVHTFMGKLIQNLRTDLDIELKKVIYFSDGCSGQYKNKVAIANVFFHERDFGVPAEWHFHATSHGKSVCDGVGGMIKHEAYLFSLRETEPGKQITTALALFKYVEQNIKGVTAIFVNSSTVTEHEEKMAVRFGTANDIDGIKSHHAFIPVPESSQVMMKLMSNDVDFVLRKISTREYELEFSEVKGFVLFSLDQSTLQLGCVTDAYEDTQSFSIQLLQPTGKQFAYEFSDDELIIHIRKLVCLVNPYFQSKGRVVKLFVKDINAAKIKLANIVK